MDLFKVRGKVQWDFSLENEFCRPRQEGYTFVIDACEGLIQLALYHIRYNFSHSVTLKKQPPRELLLEALHEQSVPVSANGLYPINRKLRSWIRYNLLH